MPQRLKSDFPIQYKAGVCYFCERPFFVNKSVLIPRFDTEILVETVILNVKEGANVLDLCTGSGCIAVILSIHGINVTASDISRSAVRVARKNARLNGVEAEFLQGDLFNSKGLCGKKFDAVVCNPPYIKTDSIGRSDKSILYEPRLALDGGHDGLVFYKRIAKDAGAFLNKGGQIFLEIGSNQAEDVKTVLQNNGFCDIQIIKDKANNERVLRAVKK